MRIAAVLAIALLGGWGLLLQNQLESAQSYEQSVAAVLDVAGQPGSLTAVLTPDGGEGRRDSPRSRATARSASR